MGVLDGMRQPSHCGQWETMTDRRAELAANLAAVNDQLAQAAVSAGRRPDEITLIAVTKKWPASDVQLLAELGVRHVGESRDQEAEPKAAECAGLSLVWHFVGQLQTKKANSVASYADVVESVDRVKLVDALERGAQQAGRQVRCLIQVSLDEPQTIGRGGVAPTQVGVLAEYIAASAHLQLGGVMGVAPLGGQPEPAFEQLTKSAELVRAIEPSATDISAGMSHDFPQAIACGATHVRLGTALLGQRPDVR